MGDGHGPFEVASLVQDAFEVHHVDGNHGNNAPRNLAILCRPCHVQLHRSAQQSGWMPLADYERRRAAAKPSRRSELLDLPCCDPLPLFNWPNESSRG